MSKKVTLEAPWDSYYKKVWNMFTPDKELEVTDLLEVEGGQYVFNIESTNTDKIIALSKILKSDISFGNISMHINFLVKNEEADGTAFSLDDIQTAFDGNPLFVEVSGGEGGYPTINTYAVMAREIISYYDDDLLDYCGNAHMLPAEIMREIGVETAGISYCTEHPAETDEE
jgi:hypothetical protein